MDVSGEIDEQRALFLAAALPLVAEQGWLGFDMDEAAEGAGIDRSEVRLLFPAGALDMADGFLAAGDERLRAQMKGKKLPKSIRERIGHLIWLRLAVDQEHKEVLRRTRIFFFLLPYMPRGLACLARTSDVIWRLAGDQSADFSYYTKRLTLSGIFSESMTVFLSTRGEDDAYVQAFIARRIEALMRLAGLFGRISGSSRPR